MAIQGYHSVSIHVYYSKNDSDACVAASIYREHCEKLNLLPCVTFYIDEEGHTNSLNISNIFFNTLITEELVNFIDNCNKQAVFILKNTMPIPLKNNKNIQIYNSFPTASEQCWNLLNTKPLPQYIKDSLI